MTTERTCTYRIAQWVNQGLWQECGARATAGPCEECGHGAVTHLSDYDNHSLCLDCATAEFHAYAPTRCAEHAEVTA